MFTIKILSREFYDVIQYSIINLNKNYLTYRIGINKYYVRYIYYRRAHHCIIGIYFTIPIFDHNILHILFMILLLPTEFMIIFYENLHRAMAPSCVLSAIQAMKIDR